MILGIPIQRRKQRGVAILMAMLFIAIVVVALATLGRQIYGSIKRTGNINTISALRNAEQSLSTVLAASLIEPNNNLQLQATNSTAKADTADASWTNCKTKQNLYEDIEMIACIYEQNGRFNLNNLVDADGKQVKAQVNRLKYLLQALDLPLNIADAIADWIDKDDASSGLDQEKQYYRFQTPSYFPANQALVSITELGLIKPFREEPEQLETLLPHITIYPNEGVESKINPNFASAALLDALIVVENEFSVDPNAQFSRFGGDETIVSFEDIIVEAQQQTTDDEAEASPDPNAEPPAPLRSYALISDKLAPYKSVNEFVDYLQTNISAKAKDTAKQAANNNTSETANTASNTQTIKYEFTKSASITVQSDYFLIQMQLKKDDITRQHFSLWQRHNNQMLRIWQSENIW